MLARAARPKLTLTVPTVTSPTIPSAAPKSPFPSSAVPSSPLSSPTARNTMLNSRAYCNSLHTPAAAASSSEASSKKVQGGILKKTGCACTRQGGKKISFSREARVNVVSPMPADYHGSYVRMGRDEVRWGLRGE